MEKVCSKCRRVEGGGEGGGAPTALHLCADCAAYERRLRARIPGREGLEKTSQPLLVTTCDGHVVAANAAFTAFAGHAVPELDGWLTGDALGCVRARLPGGCGRTMHCHACTIRRMIAEVGRTRLARWRVPAYILGEGGRREVCVSIRPEGEDLVVVAIEEVTLQQAQRA